MNEELGRIFLRAVFSENLALAFFLGMCTFLAVSRRVVTAAGLGLAVIGVQAVTVPLNHLVLTYLLAPGAWEWAGLGDVDLTFLKIIAFIGVIAATVQVLEMLLDSHFPRLHAALGIYLPLLTVNCAILGGSLFMENRGYDLTESIAYGIGSGAGWALAITALAAIRERLAFSDVPEGLRGVGLAFLVTGLMSMGFGVFSAGSGP